MYDPRYNTVCEQIADELIDRKIAVRYRVLELGIFGLGATLQPDGIMLVIIGNKGCYPRCVERLRQEQPYPIMGFGANHEGDAWAMVVKVKWEEVSRNEPDRMRGTGARDAESLHIGAAVRVLECWLEQNDSLSISRGR